MHLSQRKLLQNLVLFQREFFNPYLSGPGAPQLPTIPLVPKLPAPPSNCHLMIKSSLLPERACYYMPITASSLTARVRKSHPPDIEKQVVFALYSCTTPQSSLVTHRTHLLPPKKSTPTTAPLSSIACKHAKAQLDNPRSLHVHPVRECRPPARSSKAVEDQARWRLR